MDRDVFLAMLDQLTPGEIDARLSSWDDEQLKLVQEYLDRKAIKPPQSQKAAQALTPTDLPVIAIATKASNMAKAALILSVGAMLAAIASGLVVYEALHK